MQESILLRIGAVALIPILWLALCTLISSLTGWRRLSLEYRENKPFTGERWRFNWGSMRWGLGYNGVLAVGIDPIGLHLSIMWPFSVAHPSLLIPWGEIRAVSVPTRLAASRIRLTFERAKDVPLHLHPQLAARIIALAAGQFTVEGAA